MPERTPRERASPPCRRCRHFHITYDPKRPWGCRWFAMKSRALPAVEVLETSGAPCRAFAERTGAARERGERS